MSISPKHVGQCPHCGIKQRFETVVTPQGLISFAQWTSIQLVSPGASSYEPDDASQHIWISAAACAHCRKISLLIRLDSEINEWMLLWPRSPQAQLPHELEDQNPDLASSLREATEILHVSPQASAALSRRALDDILMDKVGAPKGNLDSKVAFAGSRLPTELAEDLNYVREVGNFGLHRKKSESTGEILQVEPGEALYTLEVVLKMVDHCYVRPVREKQWREQMKAKLADAKRDS